MRKADEFSKLKSSYLDVKRKQGAVPKTLQQCKNTPGPRKCVAMTKSRPKQSATTTVFEIEHLPNEILFKIFRYLNVKSLLSCASVCKKWELIANDNSFWKVFYAHYVWKHVAGNKDGSSDNNSRQEPPSPVEPPEKYWKDKFFTGAKKIRNKVLLRSARLNKYYGVLDGMPRILNNLGGKFQISLVSKEGTEFDLEKSEKWFCTSSSMINCYDSNTAINLSKIVGLRVYFLAPIMCGKGKKILLKGPSQKSLLFEEKLPVKIFSKENLCASDDKVVTYRTKSGNLVAVWKGTTEVAFVSVCLHHHLLLQKCLFSTSNKTFSKKHEVVPDDVDRRYGLHGYRFVCQLFSPGNEHLDFVFSSDTATSDTVTGGFITFSYARKLSHENFIDSGFRWRTEFFEGLLEHLSVFTVTAQDMNGGIIWAATSFVRFEKSGSDFVNFDQISNHGLKVCYADDVGRVEMFFIESEDYQSRKVHLLQSALISLNLQVVNSWFGTRH